MTERLSRNAWRITLRWSHEALAAVAYELTFWYMARVGEVIYAKTSPWPEMTPEEAGRCAIKRALYFAATRSEKRAQYQRAIALYNVYGFGYALGMNFRNERGEREILFPEDLDEIAECGRTKHGCCIR